MMTNLKIAVAIAAMACCTSLSAQDCGCSGYGSYGYAPVNTGGCGGFNNCGREISQGDAAALWGNYCCETCPTRCGLLGRLHGQNGHGGCGGGACGHGGRLGGGLGGGCGCGCDQGCFGYPTGGCGCAAGGGLASGLLAGKLGGGCGKCGRKGLCGCRGKRSRRGSACGEAPVGFAGGCDTCGCNDGGGYFDQPVGYEYGTAGMHSAVQGCATDACGGIPAPPAHGQAPEIVGEAMSGAAAEPGHIPADGGN